MRLRIADFAVRIGVALLAGVLTSPASFAAERRWENGFPDRPDFFPLCVWVQNTRNAERYKAIGVNTYVALYRGPTDQQLADLEKAGMYAVCQQSERSLKFRDSKVIVAWMHNDEPDNAQRRRDGQPGWGPPVAPEKIVADYERMKAADPTRPVLLNLGQGVAWDNWIGRGVRSRHPEDYPKYLKGCDIASFDIYPLVHDNAEVAGKLEFVGNGVRRLVEWTEGRKPAWACIETTHISNEQARPTPQQIKSEVWMAIAHGASGIIYFCHEFKPEQIEAGLLQYPEIVEGVKAVNAEVTRLAPVINSPTVTGAVKTRPGAPAAEGAVATLCKRYQGALYVIAASRVATPTRVTFSLESDPSGPVTVENESRTIAASAGTFEDEFDGYGVHVYRLPEAAR